MFDKILKTFSEYKSAVTAVVFSPNGLYFASGALDDIGNTIEIRELKSGRKVMKYLEVIKWVIFNSLQISIKSSNR
jgi:WD40 repeat protein